MHSEAATRKWLAQVMWGKAVKHPDMCLFSWIKDTVHSTGTFLIPLEYWLICSTLFKSTMMVCSKWSYRLSRHWHIWKILCTHVSYKPYQRDRSFVNRYTRGPELLNKTHHNRDKLCIGGPFRTLYYTILSLPKFIWAAFIFGRNEIEFCHTNVFKSENYRSNAIISYNYNSMYWRAKLHVRCHKI